jgi:hypothetical protein
MEALCDTLEALLQGDVLGNISDGDRLLYAAALAASIVVLMILEEEEQAEEIIQPRVKRTRTARRLFDCQGAFQCIRRDHLGDMPLFGKDFQMFFRLSRTRVQMILEDLGRWSDTNPFYKTFRMDMFGRIGASLEAKVLLPLKALAYGVAPHCFCDYF